MICLCSRTRKNLTERRNNLFFCIMRVVVSETRDIASLIIGRGVPSGLEKAYPCLKYTPDGPVFDRNKLEKAEESVLLGIWYSLLSFDYPEADKSKEIQSMLEEFSSLTDMEKIYRDKEQDFIENEFKLRAKSDWDAWDFIGAEIDAKINFCILNSLELLGKTCTNTQQVRDRFVQQREHKRENLMKDIYKKVSWL